MTRPSCGRGCLRPGARAPGRGLVLDCLSMSAATSATVWPLARACVPATFSAHMPGPRAHTGRREAKHGARQNRANRQVAPSNTPQGMDKDLRG